MFHDLEESEEVEIVLLDSGRRGNHPVDVVRVRIPLDLDRHDVLGGQDDLEVNQRTASLKSGRARTRVFSFEKWL